MRVLTEAETRELVTFEESYRVVEEAYREYGQVRSVLAKPAGAVMLVAEDPPSIVLAKGAFLPSAGVAGTRLAMQFGNYYCFVTSTEDNRLLGVIEETWLFRHRVDVTAGVAAKHLARKSPKVIGLIGADQLNEEAYLALGQLYPAAQFKVCARRIESATAFASRLGTPDRPPIRAVKSAGDAIEGADVVVAITLATEPMVHPGMLAPGALMLSMGGVPEVAYPVLAEIDRLIVDDFDYAFTRGDLACWVDAGEITREALAARVDCDIGEVVLGAKPGRTSAAERILAVIQGMAHCDLALAKHYIDKANAAGVGTFVDSIAASPGRSPPAGRKMIYTPYPTIVPGDGA